MEIFKDIKGYEGHYQVSNLGNIKSLKGMKNIILVGGISKDGYKRVSLSIDNIQKSYSTHRLVLSHFIPNIYNKQQVNHINGIKTDNRVGNLEWCTAKENTIHAVKTGLMIQPKGKLNKFYGKRGGETIRAKKVIDNKTGLIYESLKDAYLTTEYSYKNVSRQLTGDRTNKTNLEYI